MNVRVYTEFKYTEMNIRPSILIMENYNYLDRDKLTLQTYVTLIVYREVLIHVQKNNSLGVKFEELFHLSHSVNCHVYTCLMVLSLDMLTYDILTGFNTEFALLVHRTTTDNNCVRTFFHVTVHHSKFLSNKTDYML